MASPYTFPDSGAVLDRVAEELSDNMHWGNTPEGHQYWSDVYHRILKHASAAHQRPGSSKRQNIVPAILANPKTGYQEKATQIVHLIDKGAIMCGLDFRNNSPSKGHLFVSIKDKDKITCLFCKSKAP